MHPLFATIARIFTSGIGNVAWLRVGASWAGVPVFNVVATGVAVIPVLVKLDWVGEGRFLGASVSALLLCLLIPLVVLVPLILTILLLLHRVIPASLGWASTTATSASTTSTTSSTATWAIGSLWLLLVVLLGWSLVSWHVLGRIGCVLHRCIAWGWGYHDWWLCIDCKSQLFELLLH